MHSLSVVGATRAPRRARLLSFPPGVDDVLLTASLIVAVEDEVTVSSVKVTVCGGIHRHLVAFLHTPDLKCNQ